jgi:DNA-directed RNA polymerase specialized sigma24 family protein
MDELDWLAAQFQTNRSHLRAVAYRMLGSLTEADDAVQESWLRVSRSGASEVQNLAGWLTTVVARVCLDMLRSRTSRREEPFGVQVPEPIASREDGIDPEREVLLADSVGPALLGTRNVDSRRAAGVRAARHVRRALRRDRSHRRTILGTPPFAQIDIFLYGNTI